MHALENGNSVVNATKIKVRPENRKELCLTISSLLNLIRDEPGCLEYKFYGESGNENSFLLVGEWRTPDALREHLDSNNFSILMGSILLLAEVSTVDFKLLSHFAGKRARNAKAAMKGALAG